MIDSIDSVDYQRSHERNMIGNWYIDKLGYYQMDENAYRS